VPTPANLSLHRSRGYSVAELFWRDGSQQVH
jgi:hypothetical protein